MQKFSSGVSTRTIDCGQRIDRRLEHQAEEADKTAEGVNGQEDEAARVSVGDETVALLIPKTAR